MLELGAYWGHYSMWAGQARPAARLHLVEPDPTGLAAGQANFARNGRTGTFVQDSVGPEAFTVDDWMRDAGIERLDVLHADIQGAEMEMLDGAAQSLGAGRIDRCLISTHSQDLHRDVTARLSQAGYRIEVAVDFDDQTTSFDGFILASRAAVPLVWTGPAPLGRSELAAASPKVVLDRLGAILGVPYLKPNSRPIWKPLTGTALARPRPRFRRA